VQLALTADSSANDLSSPRSPSTSRRAKVMVASVAMASAGALAITPVTPSMPTARDIEQHAVSLSASANPLDDLGALFQNTLTNVGTLGGSILTTSIPSVAHAITNPAIYADFVKFLGSNALNPLPLLQQLVGFPGTYGGVIGAGMQAGAVALQTRLEMLPTVLTNTLNFLSTGQFVEAFSEVNVWFLVSIERALVPLLPTLAIPGDLLSSLPNGQRLAAVFDTLLKRGVFTEFTRSLLGPAASAGLQFALVLDDIRAAAVSGDLVAAASHLVSLPIKVTNALVNGFTPPFSTRSPWTGILGDRGTLDYFFVDLPKALADAFNNPVFPVPTPPVVAQSLVSDVASTNLALTGDVVTLPADADAKVGTPVGGAVPVTEAGLTTEVPAETPAETTVPEVDDASGTGADTAGESTDADGGQTGTDDATGSAGGATGGSGDDATGSTDSDDDKPTGSDKTDKSDKPRGSDKTDKTDKSDKTDNAKSDKDKSDKDKSDNTKSDNAKSGSDKSDNKKSDNKSGGDD
jgi:hypothetical protein